MSIASNLLELNKIKREIRHAVSLHGYVFSTPDDFTSYAAGVSGMQSVNPLLDVYLCDSVDTANRRWNGRKVNIETGSVSSDISTFGIAAGISGEYYPVQGSMYTFVQFGYFKVVANG